MAEKSKPYVRLNADVTRDTYDRLLTHIYHQRISAGSHLKMSEFIRGAIGEKLDRDEIKVVRRRRVVTEDASPAA